LDHSVAVMNEKTSSKFRNKTHQLIRYGLGLGWMKLLGTCVAIERVVCLFSLTTLGTILLEHKQTKEWYGFNWKKSSICAYDDGDQNPTFKPHSSIPHVHQKRGERHAFYATSPNNWWKESNKIRPFFVYASGF